MSLLHRVLVAFVVLAPLTITQVLAAVAQDAAVYDGTDATASLVAVDAPPADLTPPTAPDDHPQGGLLQMLGIDTRCDTHNCARVRLDTDVNNANVLDTRATESGQSMLVWGPHPIWNAGNQGTGSGLDADKLDGINSDVFVLTDRANRFTEDQTVEANLFVTPAPWGGGMLGIGTTDPQRALDVVGGGRFTGGVEAREINFHDPDNCECDYHLKVRNGKLEMNGGTDLGGMEMEIGQGIPGKFTMHVSAEFRKGVTVNGDGTGGPTIRVLDPQDPSIVWELTGPGAEAWIASVEPNKGFLIGVKGLPPVFQIIGNMVSVPQGLMEVTNNAASSVLVLNGNGPSGIVFIDTSGNAHPQWSAFAGNDAFHIKPTGATTSTTDVQVTGSGLHVVGDTSATGVKSALVPTTQGMRRLYAIESPEVRFMDEGSAHLVNGVARIDLDPLFAETIEGELFVHVTPRGPSTLYVPEQGPDWFVVRSTDGTDVPFVWQVSAFRKGFADVRLDSFTP